MKGRGAELTKGFHAYHALDNTYRTICLHDILLHNYSIHLLCLFIYQWKFRRETSVLTNGLKT